MVFVSTSDSMPLDQLDQLAQMTKEVAAPSVAILLYLTDPHKVLCVDFLYHFHLLVDLHHSLLDSTTNMEVHGNACTDSKKTGLYSFVDKSIPFSHLLSVFISVTQPCSS